MKKYIKPVADCYNVKAESLLGTASVGLSDESADTGYLGGGDSKRGLRGQSFDIYDDEEDY